MVNNFWNANTLVQTATDASFFAIMAVGPTVVIISRGIDLSVGSIYALAGVSAALLLRRMHCAGVVTIVLAGLGRCLGIGIFCCLLNLMLVVVVRLHHFIIALVTM